LNAVSQETATWLTSVIAIYAAVVATGALALEVRRWFESGPRIVLNVIADAGYIGGYEKDENTYISVTATNKGNLPTSVTNMLVHSYDNFWSELRNRPLYQAVITNPGIKSGQHIPYVLEPGKLFHGAVPHDNELAAWRKGGRMFVGICCSHRKKPYMKRIKPALSKTME
jgi:hypothetical protein